jgi:hypothetical protein
LYIPYASFAVLQAWNDEKTKKIALGNGIQCSVFNDNEKRGAGRLFIPLLPHAGQPTTETKFSA